MRKLMLKPVGMVGGMAASVIAGIVVKRIWRMATGEDETPDANNPDNSWATVIAAAALQGVVFATAKAAIDRAMAGGVQRLTPDETE